MRQIYVKGDTIMLICVLAVGDVPYGADAEAVLTDYFERHKQQYVFVKDLKDFNPKKAHPSWMKLIMHRMYPGHDFILNWDLDLLPVSPASSCVWEHIDPTMLNMAVDTSLLSGCSGWNKFFRYNGGLMGIPAASAHWCETLYDTTAPGNRPSYEQYYLNDAIAAYHIEVATIPQEFNTLYPRNLAWNAWWRKAVYKHYTFGPMPDAENRRARAVKEHRQLYFTDK